mmetsp:Transcript_74327/g.194970  ORF Transcript_74327/g.194970 Transcript_74327/m.194970 type:complete len:218 (+) Transcript_74327:159-812(+)
MPASQPSSRPAVQSASQPNNQPAGPAACSHAPPTAPRVLVWRIWRWKRKSLDVPRSFSVVSAWWKRWNVTCTRRSIPGTASEGVGSRQWGQRLQLARSSITSTEPAPPGGSSDSRMSPSWMGRPPRKISWPSAGTCSTFPISLRTRQPDHFALARRSQSGPVWPPTRSVTALTSPSSWATSRTRRFSASRSSSWLRRVSASIEAISSMSSVPVPLSL